MTQELCKYILLELGWASAYNKFIVILLNEKQSYSALVKNITTITPGHVIWYNGEEKNALPEIDSFLETVRASKGEI